MSSLESCIDELSLDVVLLDLHLFLRAYRGSFWEGRPSDTPLRTVRTIIYKLAALKGPKVGFLPPASLGRRAHPELHEWPCLRCAAAHVCGDGARPRGVLPREHHHQDAQDARPQECRHGCQQEQLLRRPSQQGELSRNNWARARGQLGCLGRRICFKGGMISHETQWCNRHSFWAK